MGKAPDKIKTKAGDLGPEHFDGEPLDVDPAERMSEKDKAEFEKLSDSIGMPKNAIDKEKKR